MLADRERPLHADPVVRRHLALIERDARTDGEPSDVGVGAFFAFALAFILGPMLAFRAPDWGRVSAGIAIWTVGTLIAAALAAAAYRRMVVANYASACEHREDLRIVYRYACAPELRWEDLANGRRVGTPGRL